MIIGNGDIASVLTDNPRFLYFASGVSNSQETRESEYQREKDLLMKQDRSLHLVYFSSLAVFYGDSRYVGHKFFMEDFIKRNFPHYTIIRLGNITWGTNPHTIINSFRAQVASGKKLKILNTFRYIIDKDEFLHWIDLIPPFNCEMNITGQRMSIQEIVEKYVYVGLHV